jgi:hypothetical protein
VLSCGIERKLWHRANNAQFSQAESQRVRMEAKALGGASPATMGQLQSDAAARTSGAERTNTSSRGGGSYRPGGGGSGRRK